jgi:hypothetical protein
MDLMLILEVEHLWSHPTFPMDDSSSRHGNIGNNEHHAFYNFPQTPRHLQLLDMVGH